jgi:hypothetical protein
MSWLLRGQQGVSTRILHLHVVCVLDCVALFSFFLYLMVIIIIIIIVVVVVVVVVVG